jgi:hypothetical protein
MLPDLNRILGRKLIASEMIMRPERVTEEHLDPCLGQTDCRYDERPLQDAEPVPEDASPHLAQQKLERATVMIIGHDSL